MLFFTPSAGFLIIPRTYIDKRPFSNVDILKKKRTKYMCVIKKPIKQISLITTEQWFV